MANTTHVYHYRVLDNARVEIRLLTVLPGPFESLLEERLETISLAREHNDSTSLISWEALSSPGSNKRHRSQFSESSTAIFLTSQIMLKLH